LPSTIARWVTGPYPAGVGSAIHVVTYLCALLLVLSPAKALVFFVVHQGLWGVYMGSVFAPGPQGNADTQARRETGLPAPPGPHLPRRPGWLVHGPHDGGLNYQIEHHLFPHLPTPHLPKAQREALGHLHRVGEPIRQTRAS
jgi:fatty acid desaturase